MNMLVCNEYFSAAIAVGIFHEWYFECIGGGQLCF